MASKATEKSAGTMSAEQAREEAAYTCQFNVTMRFYGPRTSVLDGSYRLPPVTRQG